MDAKLSRRNLLINGVGVVAGAGAAFNAWGAGTGVTDREILIGQSTALSGPLSEVAKQFTDAAAGYFEFVNHQGGINGRRVKLITKDDAYVPAKTAENTKSLIENEGVLALFGFLGVPNSLAALPIATETKTPFIFPMNLDAAVRRTPNRYFFTATASFDDEIDKLVSHVVTIGAKKVSVANFKNPFGHAIRDAAERSLKSRGLKLHSAVEFDIVGDKVKAAGELAASAPEAIILGAVGIGAAEFIGVLKATGSAALILTFSGVSTDILFRQLGVKSSGVIVSQVMPFPWTAAIPIVREYHAVCKSRGQNNYSHLGLWGHISARVTIEALRRAGTGVSREKLVDALEGMRSLDLGGYMVDFSPTKHHGSKFADITLLSSNGKLVK